MSGYFSYILLGLSLSAPIGPVNAVLLDESRQNGMLAAWLFGIGAVLADVAYMVLVYFGVIHFITIPYTQTLLWLFGSFAMVYTGIEGLLNIREKGPAMSCRDGSLFRPLFTGLTVAMANPLTILLWLGVYGSILAQVAATHRAQELPAFSLALLVGIAVWVFVLATAGSAWRKAFSPGAQTFVTIVAGIPLIAFGLYFGFGALRILFG